MNTPNCKSCEILARHGQTMLVHTCRINPYALSHTAPSVSASTTVPEREGVEPTQIHEPYCKKLHVGECDCISNPPSEKQEAEGLQEKLLDRFYALYLEGRRKEKAPQSYIDYFKASKFLLDEIDQTRKEAALKTLEENKKITVSWDIADGGNEWTVQFWKSKPDGSTELIAQLDKNSDDGGSFVLSSLSTLRSSFEKR